MKKVISTILRVAMVFALLGAFTGCSYAAEDFSLQMQIDNPIMTVNGVEQEIDPGIGTTPVIRGERTLVPIRNEEDRKRGSEGEAPPTSG